MHGIRCIRELIIREVYCGLSASCFIHIFISGGSKGQKCRLCEGISSSGAVQVKHQLRGVKTDSPEMFGIYMMVADGGYRLIKLGECLVKMGQMEYSGVFNPDNINDTGYSFRDICGLAVAREDARYDCMLSMWKDEDVTPDMLVFSGMDAKKQAEAEIVIKERMRRVMRKRNDRRQQSLRWSDKRWLDTMQQ